MSETKKGIAQDGYQPLNKGYQPKNDFNSGYKPIKQTSQPAPPPKKP